MFNRLEGVQSPNGSANVRHESPPNGQIAMRLCRSQNITNTCMGNTSFLRSFNGKPCVKDARDVTPNLRELVGESRLHVTTLRNKNITAFSHSVQNRSNYMIEPKIVHFEQFFGLPRRHFPRRRRNSHRRLAAFMAAAGCFD